MISYKHLKGYLERYTVLKLWRLHIRIHNIKSDDATPFLHTHPFHYISIILRGGYIEATKDDAVKRNRFNVIFRKASTAHRIYSVENGTKTLFITWRTNKNEWRFEETNPPIEVSDWIDLPKGIYIRELYGKKVYSKFDKYWHKKGSSIVDALIQDKPSIDQTTQGRKVLTLKGEM